MKFSRLRFAVIIVVAVSLVAVTGRPLRADLAGDIRAVLDDKYLRKVQVGISVARLGPEADESDSLYRSGGDAPLIPASNLKLLTTSAFLDQLGGDFKFRTMLLARGQDLYLVGDGDPTLGDVEMLRKLGWDTTTVFRAWAEELKKRGVTSVRNVLVDDSVFDEQFVHPNWLARYSLARYSAQVGGVNLNANCIDFYLRAGAPGALVEYAMEPPETRYVTVANGCVTGRKNAAWITRPPGKNELELRGEINATLGAPISLPIHDPPMFAATVLAETLQRSGVSVTGSASRDRTARGQYAADPGGWGVVAVLDTKLSTVLERANKDSMNLYAEALCKRLGFAASSATSVAEAPGGATTATTAGASEPGSWANGTAAVGAFLKKLGVPDEQFRIDDGCGLSRENAISADALVSVLAYNFRHANRDVFMSSLAVAGADGTFKERFRNDLRGRVLGKSGYVSGVSAISGYLRGRDDRWYAFSILMNNVPEGTNPDAKKVQEKIIAAIDENAAK